MSMLKRFGPPLATLALVALVAGCPGNNTSTNPAGTDTKVSKKPSAEPIAPAGSSPTPSPLATIGSVASPTVTPSAAATLPPSSTAPASTTPVTSPTATASTAAASPTATAAAAGSAYVQIERLARPAINEGLIRDPALLNAWNSVGPDKDMTDAGAPIRTNAVGTLTALGNDQAQIDAIVAQFLPDVMRIDTTITSGYVSPAGADPNAFTNLSATKKIPIGGRMIKDDVMDATLAVLVPNGAPAATRIDGLESDGVAYETNHDPLLVDFPYLAAPN